MSRTQRATAVTIAALTPVLMPGAPARAAAREAQVRLLSCHQARLPAERQLLVEASMRALTASERLEVRFDLERRARPGSPAARVPGPGLHVYNRAAPGVGAYRFRKRIANLFQPGYYRVVASFRWLDTAGAVVGRAVRIAPVCHQAELRPDLALSSLAVGPASEPGRAAYAVVVRNLGGSRAPASAVRLVLAGQPRIDAPLPALASGRSRTVVLSGPACAAGAAVTVIVDPDRQVPEAFETNNVAGRPCPVTGPAES